MKRALPLFAVAALTIAASGPAEARQIEAKEVASNSIYKDTETLQVYDATDAINEESATMWLEGDGSAGLGKYFEVKFDGEVELAKMRVWAGCFLDEDFWKRHNRLAIVEVKYPDFTSEKFELEDKMEPQWLTLKEPKKVSSMKVYLRKVYEGSTWNASGITQIEFFDREGPSGRVEGLTAAASSEYPSDEGSYAAAKAVDGWRDTYWVASSGSSDGSWLDVDLNGSKSLKTWSISVGNDMTETAFSGSSRPGRATLSFSDGSSQSFDIEDKRGLQTFTLSPVTASRVKVTFSNVLKGAAHDDLYVGEVRFSE